MGTFRATPKVAEVRAEHLLTELLIHQGWDTRRPPNGDLLRQHEYKDHVHLLDVFVGISKKGGGGDALPEAILVGSARESVRHPGFIGFPRLGTSG